MADENGTDPDPVSGDPENANPEPSDCSVSVADVARVAKEPGDFEPQDKFHGAWQPEALTVTLASDGLPDMSIGDLTGDAPPPLTYDTLVCVEDAREFVEVWLEEVVVDGEVREPWLTWILARTRDWGFSHGHVPPSEYAEDSASPVAIAGHVWAGGTLDARRVLGCLRSKYHNPRANGAKTEQEQLLWSGADRERRVFPASEVRKAFGCYEVGSNEKAILVRPRRPACAHYRRQVFARSGSSPGEPGHLDVHRNCMVRRSIGGAHLGLTDEAVYCCEHRSPPDPASAKYIEERDLVTLRKKPHMTLVPFFGAPGEDRVLDNDPYGLDNVFRRKF